MLVAATLAGGMVVAGAAAASAKGGPAGGSVSCSVNAVLGFSPALQSGATGNTNVTLHMELTKCTAAGLHHRTTGHVATAAGSIPNGTCTLPTSVPAFSGLSIRWTPGAQVKPSSVASPGGGSVSTLTNGRAQVSFTDLAVTGSFATSTTPGMATLTTKATAAALEAACNATGAGGGLAAIGVSGKVTL